MRVLDEKNYIQSGGMSANIIGDTLEIGHLLGLSIQARFAGSSPTGNLIVQYSNDNENWFTGETQAVSANGQKEWNLSDIFWKFARVSWVFTSGTGALDVSVYGKGA